MSTMKEKLKAVAGAIAAIEKQFGKGAIMKMGDKDVEKGIEVVSTGSLGLDMALGVGGLPRGRVVEIYGPESSGKTTLTLQVSANIQKLGGTAAFIDAEHALDPQYAQRLGDRVQRQRRLPRRFGAVDLDDAAARQAADAERDVEADRSRRARPDLGDVAARQRHARALAELLFDGRDGAGHGLQFLLHAGHGSLLGQVVG